jgi:hypothetical protein
MESVEHGFALAFGNARTRIIHTQSHASAVVPDAHLDATATTSEFDRVVDKYSRQSVNEGGLRLHEPPAVSHLLEGQLDPLRCRQRTKALDNALNLSAHVSQTRAVSEGHLIVNPGQPEQVLNDPPQPIALSTNPLEDFAIRSRLSRSIEGKAYFCLDHRDGGSQLMRRIGCEFCLSSSDELGGRRCPQTDHRRTSEHNNHQDASEDKLGNE